MNTESAAEFRVFYRNPSNLSSPLRGLLRDYWTIGPDGRFAHHEDQLAPRLRELSLDDDIDLHATAMARSFATTLDRKCVVCDCPPVLYDRTDLAMFAGSGACPYCLTVWAQSRESVRKRLEQTFDEIASEQSRDE